MPGLGGCALSWAVVVAALAGAAWLDVRRREVPLEYWYAAARLAAPLGVVCYAEAASQGVLAPVLAGNLAAVGIAGASLLAGLLGGADFFAVALVSLGAPVAGARLFPAGLLVLLYASALALPTAFFLCAKSLAALRRQLPAGRLLPRCFIATPMRVSELRVKPWWYPAGSDYVNMDPDEAVAMVAWEKGEEGVAWATPGIPFLAYMLLGALLAYTLAEAPLAALLGR